MDLLENKCTYYQEYFSGNDITVSSLSRYKKLSFIMIGPGGGAESPSSTGSGASGGGSMLRFNTVTNKPVRSFTYRIGIGGYGGDRNRESYENGGNGDLTALSITFQDNTIYDMAVNGGYGGVNGGGGRSGGSAGYDADIRIGTGTGTGTYIENVIYVQGLAGGSGRGSGGSYQANPPTFVKNGYSVDLTNNPNTRKITNPPSYTNASLNYPTSDTYVISGIGIGGYGIRAGSDDTVGNNGGDGYIRCYFA